MPCIIKFLLKKGNRKPIERKQNNAGLKLSLSEDRRVYGCDYFGILNYEVSLYVGDVNFPQYLKRG